MIAIIPADVIVTASNIPDADNPVYDPVVTYNIDSLVTYQDRNYKCAADGTTGVLPTDTTKWTDQGATNKMKMFDDKNLTQTVFADEIKHTFTVSGLAKAIAFINLEATDIKIVVSTELEGIVYDKTHALADAGVDNIYDYLFKEYQMKDRLAVLDLGQYAGVTIDVTISGGDSVKCGACVVGSKFWIGDAQFGFDLGGIDYSKFVEDGLGGTEIKEGAAAITSNTMVRIPTAEFTSVHRLIMSRRARWTVFLHSELYPDLFIYGLAKNFRLIMTNGTNSDCSLDLKGRV